MFGATTVFTQEQDLAQRDLGRGAAADLRGSVFIYLKTRLLSGRGAGHRLRAAGFADLERVRARGDHVRRGLVAGAGAVVVLAGLGLNR